MVATADRTLAPGGASVERDAALAAWVDQATAAASRIGESKFTAVEQWPGFNGDLREALARFDDLAMVISAADEIELGRQVLLAAVLRGWFVAAGGRDRRRSAHTASLFDRLPFREAIDALYDRLAITKDLFLQLDAAARSRAFTMARVANQQILEAIHDELVIAVNNGETFADFSRRLAELRDRSGWTGTSNWHYRLVYEQNLGMAYSAGRYGQGVEAGLSVVRILPSLAESPRADHAIYAGKLFRITANSMLPPWDFGCQCGWEWVFAEELEAMGKQPADFPVLPFTGAGQEFQWRPASFLSAA